MVYKTAAEVIQGEYDNKMRHDPYFTGTNVPEGKIQVLVVHIEEGYDVWNIHPLRKGWQKVYTLEDCNPQEQMVQSLAALKRLFEKE